MPFLLCSTCPYQVDAILLLCTSLKDDHASIKTKTAALRTSCDRMVRDKQTLVEFADALRNKLRHFEELDSLSADIARVRAHPEGDGFAPLLQRLDDCSAYTANTLSQHAESDTYVVKVRQLQAQAMAAIQQRIASVLRRAHDRVVEAARERGGRGPPAAVLAAVPAADEPAVLVVQFRAVVEAGVKGAFGLCPFHLQSFRVFVCCSVLFSLFSFLLLLSCQCMCPSYCTVRESPVLHSACVPCIYTVHVWVP